MDGFAEDHRCWPLRPAKHLACCQVGDGDREAERADAFDSVILEHQVGISAIGRGRAQLRAAWSGNHRP
jgi:hypothetical protein